MLWWVGRELILVIALHLSVTTKYVIIFIHFLHLLTVVLTLQKALYNLKKSKLILIKWQ